ncbi:MAG: hypothetical protein JWL98_1857, partial [Xanthomonadaceae bacterium]|nr:hypothetical protein [Xanthomonadaceae bacterium]
QLKALGGNAAVAPSVATAALAFKTALSPLVEGEGEQAPLNLSAIGGELTSLQADLEASDGAPTAPQRVVFAEYASRLQRALRKWMEVKANDLPELDAALKAARLPTIRVPPVGESPAVDRGASREMP